MTKQGEINNSLGGQVAALISVLLPVLQFFFQWLPSNLSGIFLGRDIFFFVSVLTFVLSLLVIFWYRTNPYFRILPFWEQDNQRKYAKYLRNTNPQTHTPDEIKKVKDVVKAPFEITPSLIASVSIPVILVLGLLFVWLGLNYQANSSILLQIFQAFVYMLTVILCAFSATYFYILIEGRQEWVRTNQTKIQRAIQLAIENNGIPEIPRINYLASGEFSQSFPPRFSVITKVEEKKYCITTDQRADILYSVEEIN